MWFKKNDNSANLIQQMEPQPLVAENVSEADAKKTEGEQSNVETQQLKQKVELLEMINELGCRITSSLSAEEIFHQFYESINSMMDAAFTELCVVDMDGRKKTFINKIQEQLFISNPFADWSFKNNRNVFLNHATEDFGRYIFELPQTASGAVPESIMAFPLIHKNKTIGTVCIMSMSVNAYNDFHVQVVQSVIPYIETALANALVYEQLLNAQEQMLQKEKQSSLGEIASGIAHEVLNPLQFVNECSEISLQLLPQIQNNTETDDQKNLKNQLLKNLEQIQSHGKQAYEIVKNMMMLRSSDSKMNLLDVNRSAIGFLNMALKTFQQKHELFQVKIEKVFEPRLPQIQMVTEDFGIILINIFTNAFYTMHYKQQDINAAGNFFYEPELLVKTKSAGNRIYISIKDNGQGIPTEIQQKIFLPFFTTKPKNQGTGLGLTISSDLISKTYNGILTFSSEPGKGSEFIIDLPAIQ